MQTPAMQTSVWVQRLSSLQAVPSAKAGFEQPVAGVQMYLGQAYVMLRNMRQGCMGPARLGYGTQNLTIFLEDVDAHYVKARAAGARIVEELHETEYGERQYGAEDLDGHLWLFSQHARDVSPEEWGATTSPSR